MLRTTALTTIATISRRYGTHRTPLPPSTTLETGNLLKGGGRDTVFLLRGTTRRSTTTAGVPSLKKTRERLPSAYTTKLELKDPLLTSKTVAEYHETYREVDESGEFLAGVPEKKAKTSKEEMETNVRVYETMVRLETMDKIFFDAQRQGRISFYMTSLGEEAATVASAAGLNSDDEIFAQYREAGALMWRGFTLQQFADQLFGNAGDTNKGRQMPMHFGSRELNYQTISSPLATQIPHASGAAYAIKMEHKHEGEKPRAVMCYFGEGAASEGDFHAGLNFASSLDCPVVFFCRNNQYAISTPAEEQFRGDGIVVRALGYGMHSIRVDGNDALAVRRVTRLARDFAANNSRPVLVEAMTYRQGHHSTSDDSTRYRSIDEIESWRNSGKHPIRRLFTFLKRHGVYDEEKDKALREKERRRVLEALTKGEERPLMDPFITLFEDVYDEKSENLKAQEKELKEFLEWRRKEVVDGSSVK